MLEDFVLSSRELERHCPFFICFGRPKKKKKKREECIR